MGDTVNVTKAPELVMISIKDYDDRAFDLWRFGQDALMLRLEVDAAKELWAELGHLLQEIDS